MEFLAIALVIIAVIFTVYPPQFTFTKEIRIIQPELPTNNPQPVDKEDTSDLNEGRPPSLDEVMEILNESIHDIVGGEDDK